MAQTSIGFDGTVNTVQWASLSRYLGADYCVDASTSLKGTAVGGVRTVSVGAGSAFGRGVLTTLSVSENVALPTPAAGQWYLIVLRRVWATKVTSLVAIPHTTTTTAVPTDYPLTYPAARLSSPGVQDDQPLLWAWANASNTTLVLVDLRQLAPNAVRVGDATERDAFYGIPANEPERRRLQRSGARWDRTDLGRVEKYFAAYSASTFPGGARIAGWYPVDGQGPALFAKNSSPQAAGVAAWVPLVFPAASSVMSAVGITFNQDTGVATIVTPGLYRVSGLATFAAAAMGSRVLDIARAGVSYIAGLKATADATTVTVEAILPCLAGDTITVNVGSGNAVNVGVAGGTYHQSMNIEYIGPGI